jgi:hypothetical protein
MFRKFLRHFLCFCIVGTTRFLRPQRSFLQLITSSQVKQRQSSVSIGVLGHTPTVRCYVIEHAFLPLLGHEISSYINFRMAGLLWPTQNTRMLLEWNQDFLPLILRYLH